MEGLIPFVYRAIAQYRNGEQGLIVTWLNESPSASYVRLPGESGRFPAPDCGFATCSAPPSAGKREAPAVTQLPAQHGLTNSCRAVK